MANQAIPASSTVLCTTAGLVFGAETTTFTTGNGTLTFQNTGNLLLHFHITTQGTSLLFTALSSGNNVTYTTTGTGDVIIGPFDPNLFGTAITITNTGVAGSVAAYVTPAKFPNGDHNPFETTATALDY